MGTRTGKRPFSFCIHPHRKAFHVSIRSSCAVPSGRQRRAFVASLGVALLGTPKLALANSLIDAFIMRMGLAWLLAAPLGCGFIGIYAAQAAAPVPPALISFAYLRLWARGNSPEKRLP